MTVIRLPRIAANDYEAVRSLLKNGITSTYPEWVDLYDKWLKEHADDVVAPIDIDPKKLATFFDTARHAHDLKTLWDFIDSIDSK
jgi:hypothetical protein